jgi:hypothetical protein
MIGFARLHEAAVRRANQARASDGDGGYILMYVLLISMLITGMVASVTTMAINNAVPTQQSAYSMSATAAAESGIQAYYAKLLDATNCLTPLEISAGMTGCAGLTVGQSSGRVKLASADSAQPFTAANQPYYTWKVLAVTDSFVRVQGTGEIGDPGSGLYATKTLTADISGGNQNFLNYGYYSTYETLSRQQIQQEYGSTTSAGGSGGPTIAFDSQSILKDAGVTNTTALTVSPSAPKTVVWNGVPSTGQTGAQWCDSVYYTPADASSTLNSETGGQGRYVNAGALPAGYDWQETGTLDPGGANLAVTHDGICEVDFTTGDVVSGQAYTHDSYLLSKGTQNGTGPEFQGPAYSTWGVNDTPSGATPWRGFPVIGGAVKNNTNVPQTADWQLNLPPSGTDALTNHASTAQVCEYWGPTRIYTKSGIAYITSPMTAANAANVCYTSHPDPGQQAPIVPSGLTTSGTTLLGAGSASVLQAQVPVTDTLIYVHNAKLAATTQWTGQTIFGVSSTTTPGTVLGTPTETTTTTATVSNMTSLQHNSTLGPAVVNSDGTLKGSTTSSLYNDFLTQLQSAFASTQGHTLYTSAAAARAASTPSGPSDMTYYVVMNPTSDPAATPYTTGCPAPTAPVSDSRLPAPTFGNGDPLLGTQVNGTSHVTSACDTRTVNATIYAISSYCTAVNLLGICLLGHYAWNPSASTAGTASATRNHIVQTTSVVSVPSTSFPLSNDITRYQAMQNGPGDAYIEGRVPGKLSVVAENDVVVTGNLTVPDLTSEGIVLVGGNDVRVYHPVGCVDTNAASLAAMSSNPTQTGYCPNDTTGLSPAGKLWFGSGNFNEHPSRQYTNLTRNPSETTPMTDLAIDAAVFALTGSFIVDNYNRGEGKGWDSSGNFGLQSNGLDRLTLDGGVYQQHHGAVGVEWPIISDSTQRPTSGYVSTITWDDKLKALTLPYVPSPTGGNGTKAWNIVSTTAGAAS